MNFDENFVLAISFIFFIYLAYKPIKKSLIAHLDHRINEIKSRFNNAAQAKKDAKLLLTRVEEKMSSFEKRKEEILHNAHNSTQRLIETQTKEMELMLARKEELVLRSIQNQRDKANHALRAEFATSIMLVVKTYLSQKNDTIPSDQEIFAHLMKK